MKNYYLAYCTFPFVFRVSPFSVSVHSQKNKKDEDKKDEEFRCPEGQGNGNFADPATCRRFYQVIIHLASSWLPSSSLYYDYSHSQFYPLILFSGSALMGTRIWTDVHRAYTLMTSASFAPSKTRRDADLSRPVSEYFYRKIINICANTWREMIQREIYKSFENNLSNSYIWLLFKRVTPNLHSFAEFFLSCDNSVF